MINHKIFSQVAAKLSDILPLDLQATKADIQQHFREILQIQFAKFQLMTREEFDIQIKVLNRSREKLEQLEKRVKELEQKISLKL